MFEHIVERNRADKNLDGLKGTTAMEAVDWHSDAFALPRQLQVPEFRFVETYPKGHVYGKDARGRPLASNGKVPAGKWSENLLPHDSDRLSRQLRDHGTYAVATGHGGLVVIDVDHEQGRAILDQLPETFTVLSGGKKLPHIYLRVEGDEPPAKMVRKVPLTPDEVDEFARMVIKDGTKALSGMRLSTLLDLQGRRCLVIGPGSRLDEDTHYEVYRDVDIARISMKELTRIVGQFGTMEAEQKEIILERAMTLSSKFEDNYLAAEDRKEAAKDQDAPWNLELWKEIEGLVTVSDVYAHFGTPMTPCKGERFPCLLGHPSQTNRDVFCEDDRFWKCFNCNEKGGAFKLFHTRMGTHDSNGQSRWMTNSIEFAGLAGRVYQKRWQDYLKQRRQAYANPQTTQVTARGSDSLESDESLLHELNKRFFVARHNGKFRVLEESTNPSGYYELVPYTEPEFNLKFANKTIQVPDGKDRYGNQKLRSYCLAIRWSRWPGRRSYDAVGFWPQGLSAEQEGKYFNAWRGFNVKGVQGEFPLLESHLRDIWCRGNMEHYRYLITWFAHLVQRPWEKPGVALVLKGGKGAGKSIIFEQVLQRILGSTYSKIDKPGQVTGQFNHHHIYKLLLVLEEAVWAGNKEAEGALKSMITEKRTMYEPKGVDAFDGDSYVRLVFISNERRAVPATGDERRYFALRISDKKQNDHAYFADLLKEVADGGLDAFMHYLQTFEFDPLDVRKPPRTDALFEDIYEGFSLFEKWAFYLLHLGMDGKSETDPAIAWDSKITNQALFSNYTAWVEQMRKANVYIGYGEIGSQTKLTQEMKRYFGFSTSKVKGVNCMCLPPLREARKIFESKVRAPITWEEALPDVIEDFFDPLDELNNL